MDTIREELRLGIDVGSTTVKFVITDINSGEVLFSCYERHNAKQMGTVLAVLNKIKDRFSDKSFRIGVCGSGGKPVADALGVHYIQEVVANAAAIRHLYPQVRTAVELGGQDAKVIFFHYDKGMDKLVTSDMRMNGSCAGGTGAFIDEIAKLLNVSSDEFESLAAKGKVVYEISGRCGVFAKTDIQPLLISGAAKEDIALSAFHAIVKQTIGGLSQGLELKAPIIFEGGPLTFNPTLIEAFKQQLNLDDEDAIRPKHPETVVAYGTAIALDELFKEVTDNEIMTLNEAAGRIANYHIETENTKVSKPFFDSDKEKAEFADRHNRELKKIASAPEGSVYRAWLGIDSGSTTSKLVLIDENENVTDTFYANNNGSSLEIVKNGILSFYEKYQKRGTKLEIMGLGTTGYGEHLFAKAFGADYHTVETVAHVAGCKKFIPDVTFLLDIGGQDMKAIWLKDGIITNIMLNEACSSGCGSFLENFAANLKIPVKEIADAAFSSANPAVLGSRCTVFMNSTIINEQRNGKQSNDIMAGLCRSIIENVFTKVVRVANTDELGDKIVVQGGTFKNFAVLRAIEEYLGKEVVLAPYPGEMGALGAALLTKHSIEENGYADGNATSFIGYEAVKNFKYKKESGVRCTGCANHCSRTIITFNTGVKWVTGNRCERGEITDELKEPKEPENKPVDMFEIRNRLLFKMYECTPVSAKKNKTIGIPRTLEFWDSMPFWTTFFRALGYDVKLSHPSSGKMYEKGIQYIASDTICFPAKLVHGHICDLAQQGVDMIFMPHIMHMPPEGTDKTSPYVCSVVIGYPMVVKNSQSPQKRYNIPFETPVFHWFTKEDRKNQICEYAVKQLKVSEIEARKAFLQAEKVILQFKKTLTDTGRKIIEQAKKNGSFAVVLAGRPYHTDPFVNHNISKLFTKKGISVLTVDGVPGLNNVELNNVRVEITNNFHTRMLEGAIKAAKTPELEYAQIVSFGCGHDAILSDEIIRIMTEGGKKPPLILKVDESDAAGALSIRVQSFIETVKIRRKNMELVNELTYNLPDPYKAKFYKSDKKKRTLLIPNASKEFSKLTQGVLAGEGFIVKTVPVGSVKQIGLGKKYVHNDICFPCQMVTGELISELQKGKYAQDEVAVGMLKFQCDCRMSHYAALLRKGLDAAGFKDVPVLTTDVTDTKNMHPGVYLFSLTSVVNAVWAFMMMDILKDLCRKIRPYEIKKGETDRVLKKSINRISKALESGLFKAIEAFKISIDAFCRIRYDRSVLKPRVLVTGEVLVANHPGSNFYIEQYLEKNGMETIFPRMTDQMRKDFLAGISEIKDFNSKEPPYPFVVDKLFDYAQKKLEKIASRHPLYEHAPSPRDMYTDIKDIIPLTLSCGEGWLMAAEIVHYAKYDNLKSFVILQPFGCLPNHICGRGVIKRIKEEYPDVQILPLDLDPDTSLANVENRLQMLIMNNQERIVS